MSVLSIDFETRSTVDLKRAGVHVYAAHPTTDIWCLAWAFDDEEPEIWTPGMALPSRVERHISLCREIRAWNAQFERLIWRGVMVPRYGAPEAVDEQFVCSAAEAAAMALPRHLAGASEVLRVHQQKDDEGHRLMLRMSKPRKIHEDGRVEWWEVEERKQRLFAYCKQDVRTERAIVQALRRLTPKEREIYLLDQRINDRGVRIDLPLVRAAQGIVDVGVQRANRRLAVLTSGNVTGVTNHARLKDWLIQQDTETESVSKAAVAALMERNDIAENVREVLQLRTDAGRTSTAKLKSMIIATCTDANARGLLLYHAASTGRWAGRLIQPQNFPRGEVEDVEQYIDDVLAGDYDKIDLFAPPIVVVLSMLRSMITARPGNKLVAGDYSAIEARVLNWLAGQDDIVELFARGEDVYKYNAAKLYNIPLSEVKKFPHRQTGKFQELACGFGMGDKKAVSAAKTIYGLDLSPESAEEIVKSYRATHKRVVEFWYQTERACKDAIAMPGKVQTFGAHMNLRAIVAGAYLYIVLPSGRPLCYAAPRVEDRLMPWGEMKPSLFYMGVDPFSKKWGKLAAYGGFLVENIVQAVSRDLMAEAMLRLEKASYTPVLSVHDEVVTEVPESFGSVEEFEHLMSELPAWGTGCPVAAEAWQGFRYRK